MSDRRINTPVVRWVPVWDLHQVPPCQCQTSYSDRCVPIKVRQATIDDADLPAPNEGGSVGLMVLAAGALGLVALAIFLGAWLLSSRPG